MLTRLKVFKDTQHILAFHFLTPAHTFLGVYARVWWAARGQISDPVVSQTYRKIWNSIGRGRVQPIGNSTPLQRSPFRCLLAYKCGRLGLNLCVQ